MTAARPQRPGQRAPHRRRDRTTLLRLEQLEDRLTPSLTAGDAPGQLLIRFQSGVTQTQIADFYADHHLAELRDFDFGGDLSIRLVATPATLTRATIPALEQDPRVRYAELNGAFAAAQVPNDPDFPRDWGLRNTGQTGGTP